LCVSNIINLLAKLVNSKTQDQWINWT